MDNRVQQRPDPIALVEKYGSLTTMRTVPQDATDRQAIGDDLWSGIFLRFEHGLSSSDKELWRSTPATWRDSPKHRPLVNAFDDFLLGQVQQWGWRTLMCRGMLVRLADWEEHSPERLLRLGEALQLRSQVFRGEERAPIDGKDLYQFKEKVFPELRILFRKAATFFGPRRERPSSLEIANWMKREVEDARRSFSFLWANLAQLHGFLAGLDQEDPDIAGRLRTGTMRPKEFIYRWLAATHRREVEVVRQMISRRETHRRARRSFLKV